VSGVESGAGSTPHCLHFFVVLAHFAWLARGLDDFALHGASTTPALLLFGKTRFRAAWRAAQRAARRVGAEHERRSVQRCELVLERRAVLRRRRPHERASVARVA